MRPIACVALCALVATALVGAAGAYQPPPGAYAYGYGYGGYPAGPLPPPLAAGSPYWHSPSLDSASHAVAEEQAAVAAAAAAASQRVARARRLETAAELTAISDARASAQVLFREEAPLKSRIDQHGSGNFEHIFTSKSKK
jgi:hypothetical protein